MHAAAGYLKSDDPDPDVVQEMTLHWGTVHDAMVSLFEAITGGNDWSSYSNPLKEAGEIYFLMFLMYIVFMLFAVMNILTGMFIDNASKVSERDLSNVAHELGEKETEELHHLIECFKEMDETKDGSLSAEEFE